MKEHVHDGAEEIKYEGNEVGILVSHGFTGTTQSVSLLTESFAEEGYTVYAPRLAGHGTKPEDMEQTTYLEWIQSVEHALKWLKERCSTVFVAGLSMGGTLALYIAENDKEIKGVISINGAIDIPAMKHMEKEEGRFIEGIGSDIKKSGTKELAYSRTPVKSIHEINQLMGVVKNRLDSVHCPILLFVSDEDHVVPPNNSEQIFEQVFSEHKELVHLENSYHVATLDNDVDLIIERSLEFVERYIHTT